MSSAVKSIGGSAIGAILGNQAKGSAKMAVPDKIRTGFSTLDLEDGVVTIDPSTRSALRRRRRRTEKLVPEAKRAFSRSRRGIRDLQKRSAELRADFEGNESAFREAQLAPLNEAIARREGAIDLELGRTDVRGSFAEQTRSAFQLDAARERRRAEAEIEDQRISRLAEFMQIDASFLDAALQNETSRISMLSELEATLGNISTEQFNREMALLGLPAAFLSGTAANAQIENNASGIQMQNIMDLAGDILDIF